MKKQLPLRVLVTLSLSIFFPSLAVAYAHTAHGHKPHSPRPGHHRKARARHAPYTKRHHGRRSHPRHTYQRAIFNPALENDLPPPAVDNPSVLSVSNHSFNLGNNSFHNQLASQLNPQVLKLALNAYTHARARGLDQQGILTIIDFSKDSTQQRMWGLDLNHNRILFSTVVAHGKNSGDRFARYFSNQLGSRASSLGLFLTENTYYGHKGISLRLKGLERGINDNAERRAIVIHGADYATTGFAQRIGRLGLSWGCPAVPMEKARSIISTIKNGTLLFAYYPNSNWLHHSNYLS